jgi:hypothetical protein
MTQVINQKSIGSLLIAMPRAITVVGLRKWLASLLRLRTFCGLMAIVEVGVCKGETLRVTSWNLGLHSGGMDGSALVDEAARTLKSLDADVILLQGVSDWQWCSQLADALKPADYSLLVCSGFRGTSLVATGQTQVAILSKRKAYFTWSQAWQSQKQQPAAQGMAFAAVQAGTQRLGFFTAFADNRSSAEELPQRILSEIGAIGRWETNQVQTFVMAASFARYIKRFERSLRKVSMAFEGAGFVDATENMPEDLKMTLRPTPDRVKAVGDCLFAGPMGFPSNTRITVSQTSEHYPMTCNLELDLDKVSTALEVRADNRHVMEAQSQLVMRKTEYWVGGILFAGLGAFVVLRVRAKRRSTWTTRGGLPVRIPAKPAQPALGPIVFAQAPPTERTPESPALPQASRPVLRVQNPLRLATPTPVQPPPLPPSSAGIVRREHTTLEEGSENQDSADPSASIPPDTEVRQGVIRELSRWLKHKLVHKLVSDRAELMQAQQVATHLAHTLDDRLGRIEAQIQQQNQAYVRRIEELNQELAAAREENRELIRERIAQVKAEMEAARARALAEANLDNTSFRL